MPREQHDGLAICWLFSRTSAKLFNFSYITMHDKEATDQEGKTREETRFRISAKMFGKLALCYELPVAFIESLLNLEKQLRHFGFGSRLHTIGPTKSLIRGNSPQETISGWVLTINA
jgi:hypothetical protein